MLDNLALKMTLETLNNLGELSQNYLALNFEGNDFN